jgi:hypothetical protein
LILDPQSQRIRTGIGAVWSTPRSAEDAERFMEGVLSAAQLWETRAPMDPAAVRHFADVVGQGRCDVAGHLTTDPYSIHALTVLVERTFLSAWQEYSRAGPWN